VTEERNGKSQAQLPEASNTAGGLRRNTANFEPLPGRRPFCTDDGVGAVLAVLHQNGLTGPVIRAVSVNQACPTKPFISTWQGVDVECAQVGQDDSHGVITPVRGTAPAPSAVPADAAMAGESELDPESSPGWYAQLQISARNEGARLPALMAFSSPREWDCGRCRRPKR
jgi:hypothetical protein